MSVNQPDLNQQMSEIIAQIQRLQRAIAGTQEPPSRFELERLEELGRSYQALRQSMQDRAAST